MEITQAKVIVTGGARGLGGATVRYLAGQGARVAIFDIGGDDGAALVTELEGVSFHEVDVTKEEAVLQGIAAAKAAMGGLNAVVNCAGIVTGAKTVGKSGPFDLSAFQRTVDINLVGSFNVARLAAAEMAGNDPNDEGERGVIVNTASIAAFEGQKGQAAYTASKAGIAGMTLPIARDLASLGIRCNAIAPGLFLTPMLESLGDEMMAELARDVIFPKRLGRPEEFASLAAFLIASPYMNGETIRIDGALRLPA
ncbi:short-chain dehydrogenase/reductase SDR [Roseibacterium elongatum DSM 19469]|uniref:Short-chain dehydrogenase/reductase SDR n=1 Tax=Roseicyclus elongatus DSM 19469 TaxID=1294273 RepID=W8S539_9RHOB|nr:SDR family NAD(P)-dependent oxidoreductase [Roseibacterium elongatum]AHM05347.1 short-chain dehydrogenase/reductase SDR [Roseibacterium elongatum DSM 19469]